MNKLMEVLKQNTVMKVFSVILAVLLWAFVQLSENPEISIKALEVPVQFIGEAEINNEDLEIMDHPEEQIIKVYISTSPSYINAVTESSVSITADVSAIQGPGTHYIDVKAHSNDQNITIENLSKNTLAVEVDYTTVVEKDVEILLDGRNDDFYLDTRHMSVTPNRAKVRLPESMINTVDKVAVVLNLGDISADVNDWYTAIPVDTGNIVITENSISIQDNRFQVKAPVLRKISVPLVMTDLPPELEHNYTLSRQTVTIAVHPKDVNRITKMYGTIAGVEKSPGTYNVTITPDIQCEYVQITSNIELKVNTATQ